MHLALEVFCDNMCSASAVRMFTLYLIIVEVWLEIFSVLSYLCTQLHASNVHSISFNTHQHGYRETKSNNYNYLTIFCITVYMHACTIAMYMHMYFHVLHACHDGRSGNSIINFYEQCIH